MLIKTFAGQANTPNDVIPPDADEVMLSRFTELASALANFDFGQKNISSIQTIIDNIVGVIPPNEKFLNNAWHFQRGELLEKKLEALVNLNEAMSLFQAHAKATYLKPGVRKCEAKYGLSIHIMLNTSCETVKVAARKSVSEALRTGVINDDRADVLTQRLDANTQIVEGPYTGADTPQEYQRLCQLVSLTYPGAMASTMRLAELDLAYIAANVKHFDRLHRVKVNTSMNEMLNLFATHSVINLKAMGEEKPVFTGTPDGCAPAPSKPLRSDLH